MIIAFGVGPNDFCRLVLGAIIDDDEINVGISLTEDAGDGFGEVAPAIIDWHNDRRRWLHKISIRP